MNKETIYNRLINKFGNENQIVIAIEEMAELQKELTKLLRGNSNLKAISEEITDVEIMIEQLKIIFGNSRDIAKMKNIKLHRVEKEFLTPPKDEIKIENLDINKI